jgi:hypothetical protein
VNRPAFLTRTATRRAALAAFGAAVLALTTAGTAAAAGVYVTSSGNATFDTALVAALTSYGHSVTLGVPFTAFDGTQSLAGIQAVYLQANYNWNTGNMPAAGQTALANFVNNGGGLVTNEWILWKTAAEGAFSTLSAVFPAVATNSFDSQATYTMNQTTANPVLNAGLSSSITFALTSISGTDTNVSAVKAGATTYYTGGDGDLALTGWSVGSGRVLNFNTVIADAQIADANFSRLLGNTLAFSAGQTAPAVVPESGTLALLGFGGTVGAVALVTRRRRPVRLTA